MLKTVLKNFLQKNGSMSFIDMNVVSFLHEILLSHQGALYDLLWYGSYNSHREGSLFRRIHMM